MATGTQTQSGTSNLFNTTTNLPYGSGGKLLNRSLSDALSLYNKQKLNPFVGMSSTTKQGLTGLKNTAWAERGSLNNALSRFTSFANGGGNVSSAGQMGIAGKAMGPSYSEQNLGDVASGKLIGQGDPNYDRLRSRALEDAATEAGMVASGMGRTGSDYHQAAVGSRVADTVGAMDYKRLQDERARQVEANSLMDTMRQSGLGLGLNATNSASSIDAANRERQIGAAAGVPGAYDATLDPFRTVTDVGRQYEGETASRLGNPGANLSSLMQALGIVSPYGTTVNTQKGTTSNSGSTKEPTNWAQYAGAGLGGLSLLKELGIFG